MTGKSLSLDFLFYFSLEYHPVAFPWIVRSLSLALNLPPRDQGTLNPQMQYTCYKKQRAGSSTLGEIPTHFILLRWMNQDCWTSVGLENTDVKNCKVGRSHSEVVYKMWVRVQRQRPSGFSDWPAHSLLIHRPPKGPSNNHSGTMIKGCVTGHLWQKLGSSYSWTQSLLTVYHYTK